MTDRHTAKQGSAGVVLGWRNLSILGTHSVYCIQLDGEVGFSIQLNKEAGLLDIDKKKAGSMVNG